MTDISIITPCLNAASTIEKTLQSVLHQKGNTGEVEHIVVDGCSSDGTLELLERYTRQYPRITFVSEPDSGIYDAMNKGISLANGRYIGIINADDWYDDKALSIAKKILDSNPDSGLVYGNMAVWNDASLEKIAKPRQKAWMRFISMPYLHPTCFVRASVYQKYGVFDSSLEIAADLDLILRLYDKGVKAEYVDHTMANFRHGGASSTNYAIGERARVRARHGLPLILGYLIVFLIDMNRLLRRSTWNTG